MTPPHTDHHDTPTTTRNAGLNGTSPSRPVDASRLAAMLEQGTHLRLLDVRTTAEFETSHIPGSRNVPLDILQRHAARFAAPDDRDLIIICRSGQRATIAQQALHAAGVLGARVLTGGVLAWQDADLNCVHGHPKWELERQIRLVAGSIVLGSVLTSTIAPKAKWVAGFIGGGLTFAALTNTCAMGMMLSKMPYNQQRDFDPEAAIAEFLAS